MFSSTGIFRYGPDIRAVVEIDSNIVEYYKSLIPKYYYLNPQKYDPHITVVRINKELPLNMAVWMKYEGTKIDFEYSPVIQKDGAYWFLDVYSQKIGDIREELELPRFRFADRPCYHISLANSKELR